MNVRACTAALAVLALSPWPSPGVTASFIPDGAIKGSSLTGWHPLGQAEWHLANGEVTATPKGSGGWLVLDHAYQDIGIFTQLRCAQGCKAGILLRAQKTPNGGLRGIFVSLNPGDTASYDLTLDASGSETKREMLRGGGRGPAPTPADPWDNSKFPMQRPNNTLLPGQWNQIEIVAFENTVRGHINEGLGGIQGGPADDLNFGVVALYAGGSAEVHYKDVAWKDMGVRVIPPEQVSSRFRMQRLNEFYYSWGAVAADINHDGIPDLVAGPYYYLGPDYTVSREIYLASTINPSTGYAFNCMFNFTMDVNGDGWPDVIESADGRPANLYINPAGEPRRWKKYEIIPKVQSEIAILRDVDGDGVSDFIYAANNHLSIARPDPSDPTKPWLVQNISELGPVGGVSTHGLGVGDINGDGKLDIVQAYGWWEQPATGAKTGLWIYHPEAFGRWARSLPGGGEMAVYDVNGDGLMDVVTGLEAHGLGLAWFEQKRDAAGKISFVQHMIMDDFTTKNAGAVTFSELHGSIAADIDGDGIPDFIVGKRYWAHGDTHSDPDAYGPPVIYLYRTV
ncbi:MAG TPA: FG-GAP-like repeat-containing protein, partial [Bryobacteraceae bacterium]|nr:FG-GAP-like repeat-containing protein [Bryobacteraceae bacterium]